MTAARALLNITSRAVKAVTTTHEPAILSGFSISKLVIDCQSCGKDQLILPLIPHEQCFSRYLRATLYFMGLVYAFMGIAIVADIFMSSIEKITSQTRKILVKHEVNGQITYKAIEDKIWNESVANLTLMALGSSAPEILLSCIEIIGNNFESGKLGTGTIVGSASFNLLIITAVCMVSCPNGEVRRIRNINVFIVTSIFSLFAYIWLIIVIDILTPNVIVLWEAVLTLLFFPILAVLAWWSDNGFCIRGKRRRVSSIANGGAGADEEQATTEEHIGVFEDDGLYTKDGTVNQEALIALYKHMRMINPDLTDDEAATLVATKLIKDHTHSRLWYRTGVSRGLMGGPRLAPVLNEKLKEVYDTLETNLELRITPKPRKDSHVSKAIIEFQAASFAVLEKVGTFKVILMRHGRLDNTVTVKVETFDGTATAFSDYFPINTVVSFAPNIEEVEIPVTIVDDVQWEPEEEFFIRATLTDSKQLAELGKVPIMEIIILDDDRPGSVSFVNKGSFAKPYSDKVELKLKRSHGCDGIVTVFYKTVDGTAVCPADYKECVGDYTFQHGEIHGVIEVPIIATTEDKNPAYFFVSLYDTKGGLKLGDITKAKVTISEDDNIQETIDKMVNMAAENMDPQIGYDSYAAQFRAALSVNGGDLAEATTMDHIMHVLTFGWKILFAFIPPTKHMYGWPCFAVALFFIGFLTALVGDLAEMFGCLIGLRDTVTAITFVALGTSVPDTFASKAAVASEKYADNAIGNVTGSNSVNVFLGLGLPWVMATIYHAVKGTKFAVVSGDLSFSVLVYSMIACVALFVIFFRRIVLKAELGGDVTTKWLTAILFTILWFGYVIASALKSYEIIKWDLPKITI